MQQFPLIEDPKNPSSLSYANGTKWYWRYQNWSDIDKTQIRGDIKYNKINHEFTEGSETINATVIISQFEYNFNSQKIARMYENGCSFTIYHGPTWGVDCGLVGLFSDGPIYDETGALQLYGRPESREIQIINGPSGYTQPWLRQRTGLLMLQLDLEPIIINSENYGTIFPNPRNRSKTQLYDLRAAKQKIQTIQKKSFTYEDVSEITEWTRVPREHVLASHEHLPVYFIEIVSSNVYKPDRILYMLNRNYHIVLANFNSPYFFLNPSTDQKTFEGIRKIIFEEKRKEEKSFGPVIKQGQTKRFKPYQKYRKYKAKYLVLKKLLKKLNID
jgi:hypothetical protein